MPVIQTALPLIPAALDSHLVAPGYFHPNAHPAKNINLEPEVWADLDLLAAAVVDAEEALAAVGLRVAPSPTVWKGAQNKGYRHHLAELLAAWLVQRDTVAHLLPSFWAYACIKVERQADFVSYISNILDHEYRTCQVWEALVRDARSTMQYYVASQHCPSL